MKRGRPSRNPRRIGWTAMLVMTAMVFPLAPGASAEGRERRHHGDDGDHDGD
jgi:hypothetical protein